MAFYIAKNVYQASFTKISLFSRPDILVKCTSKWTIIQRTYSDGKLNPITSAVVKEINKPVLFETKEKAVKLKPGEVII